MKQQSFTWELGKEDRWIRGEVWSPEKSGSYPVLILSHGFKGFKDWGFFPYAARTLAQAGFAAVTFNFSMNGIGEDPERFTELDKFAGNTYTREQEDLAYLLGRIREKKLPDGESMDPDRIGLIGHSRGGGNSLLRALEDPNIAAVALWNSIARLNLFSDDLKQEMREHGRTFIPNARTGQQMPIDREVLEDLESNRERFNLLDRLPRFHRPLLILQGENDPAVPVETARELDRQAPQGELHILPGADHTFNAVHPFQGTTPELEKVLEQTIHFFHHHFQ
ncbi:alpha/beta hydrolase family protein [Paludifilum halophilum]|uniref:AB hydrolase-1 domain-containing protein n=1 Tax=Paludifilum halophilum TaxID=1642702 RepID=A0A235B5B5_9BACL|nr:alpha/beta fold hydrolase [Paludifilum halophilum]OYD07500.1 hypothetical protein CHM34_11420 [Paludifilum halophilum]